MVFHCVQNSLLIKDIPHLVPKDLVLTLVYVKFSHMNCVLHAHSSFTTSCFIFLAAFRSWVTDLL